MKYAVLTILALWNISSSCASREILSLGGGEANESRSLRSRIFCATYYHNISRDASRKVE